MDLLLLNVDVEQARFDTLFLPGTWQATIIYGQYVRESTRPVQGRETHDYKTEVVWHANKTLEVQQNEKVEHLVIEVFRNQEFVCVARVPLMESTRESQSYELETSPGQSCGHVKLAYTVALQCPQIRSKGDPNLSAPSYYSGRAFSSHVPWQQMNYSTDDPRVVPPPGTDRYGSSWYMSQDTHHNSHGIIPTTYSVPEYPHQEPINLHQQIASEQQQRQTYPPQQSNNGLQYTAVYQYGGDRPYGTSHPPGANNQYARGNYYGSSYLSGAVQAPAYGRSSHQPFAPDGSEYDNTGSEYDNNGYYGRDHRQ